MVIFDEFFEEVFYLSLKKILANDFIRVRCEFWEDTQLRKMGFAYGFHIVSPRS